MKNVADMTDKLADLHKKMKDLDEDKSGPSKVTNNAMFVGSTSMLRISSMFSYRLIRILSLH